MDTPKTVAARVTKQNYDVIAAAAPGQVSRFERASEIYGLFVVLNKPRFVLTDDIVSSGIMLVTELISEDEFERRYTYRKTDNPFSGKFIRVVGKPREHLTTPRTQPTGPRFTFGR